MKKSSIIGHVCELLELIRPLKQPADSIVKDFFRQRHYLGSKDRRFISDTTFAILRNFTLVRFHANEALRLLETSSAPLDEPPPGSLALGGSSQRPIAMYVSFALKVRNEDAGALLSDVESSWRISLPKVSCEEFIRAVAQAQLPQTALANPVKRISMMHSFPETIIQEWIERFGEEETGRLCAASNQPAPIVIRVNTLKTTVEECRARLRSEGIESEPTKLSAFGLVLKKRINAQALQSFNDGWFEMQDEGSQLVALLLESKPGDVLVDACAGGGGKTLSIAALMKNEGKLIAFDVDAKRLANIQPRLRRAGVGIAQLHRAESRLLEALEARADAVLVDAPCSGVGTFRRNPWAKLSFDENFAERISITQKRILETFAPLVKPGGRLVYSTCTLLQRENEEVVESFLAVHCEFSLLSPSTILQRQSVFVESPPDYLMLLPPSTDGFFAATLQKK